MADIQFAHALRICRKCKLKFKDEKTLQLAVLGSPDPIRAVCGEYFKPDFVARRACPQCQLRFGLKFKELDVCSICEGTADLE